MILISPYFCFSFQEPSNKRVRPPGRVTSLANLISPVKNGAVRRFGQTIQVSSTRREPIIALSNLVSSYNLSDIWGILLCAGLLQGRWQVAGYAPEALQQGSGPHTT